MEAENLLQILQTISARGDESIGQSLTDSEGDVYTYELVTADMREIVVR